MNNLTKRLGELKERIQAEQQAYNEAMGELKAVKTQLKKEFNVDSLEEAEKIYQQLTKEIGQMGDDLQRQLSQIEEELQGGN